MTGYLAEVVGTKGAVADAELAALEAQLMAKYAITP
jgi:hypothetical protein